RIRYPFVPSVIRWEILSEYRDCPLLHVPLVKLAALHALPVPRTAEPPVDYHWPIIEAPSKHH
ncbi:MAG: hypothetical protein Q8O86_03850, partial [Dehalococcoidia bacterium]|nr:hypothetical protein [Dehalococcoidia bacterium]